MGLQEKAAQRADAGICSGILLPHHSTPGRAGIQLPLPTLGEYRRLNHSLAREPNQSPQMAGGGKVPERKGGIMGPGR